jgi:cation:H+ antiporter
MEQTLLMNLISLAGGIVLLVLCGNYLVKGSVAIANHLKVSSLVIGLTVVAFGTSAPELIVSLGAALTGHPEIALGNVIGSNIANIALVLALTVIILPIPVSQQTIKRSWPIMFASGAILFGFMTNNVISQNEGILMFVLLILFIISSIKSAKRFPEEINVPKPENKYKIGVYYLFVILASGGLALGSRFLVKGASGMAMELGISERLISITIVAFGTSIPELTASVSAAFKKETDISVGNIVGSNIFNVFAVIGISAGIHPIPFNFSDFRIDLNFMMMFYALLLLFILPLRTMMQHKNLSLKTRYSQITAGNISRKAGIVFILLYALYIFILFKF